MKQIYDVNKLDLVKVGKSFGLPVPPRVNLKVGGGQGGSGRAGKKRRRDDDDDEESDNGEEWEEIDAVDKEEGDLEDEEEQSRKNVRKTGKGRRTETLGKRKVEKEVYKKGLERKKMKAEGSAQWSR